MTKLDEYIGRVDPTLLVFRDPTGGEGKPFFNFGQERIGKNGKKRHHFGIDIPLPIGSEVQATENGLFGTY